MQLAHGGLRGSLLSLEIFHTITQVWDARKLREPLAAFADLPAAPQSQCVFSPDESLIATGTAKVPGAPGGGALVS